MPEQLTCGVVVPSYRRPDTLRSCLRALLDQQLAPAEIIVVAHADDVDNHAVVAAAQNSAAEQAAPAVRLVTVDRPGLVFALEAGVQHARADIIAFTDDDARPRPDWLMRLKATISSDSTIAGAGGRDVPARTSDATPAQKRDVGTLAWFGRVSGNHHLGVGPARDVHVLKGVNCAYRSSILRQVGYDHRLRGQIGYCNELALGLAIVRLGGRLIYDPGIQVDHEEAPRDERAPRVNALGVHTSEVDDQSFSDAVFNETLALTEHLAGVRRLTYRLWSTLVGHRDSPGLVQAIRFTPALGRRSWRRWRVAEQARREARRLATTHR